ncbi:hypothetical protein XM38_011040 [Halomicronema hongdechloris C2206]|uniref:DUF3370 domain-containing protein n=1 Tax=Halomicronema hongdechloris C2206 TaxID=1641165 RepID=A0A1Z3HIM9_9CYAN|nr:DUF3370 domain-containing protein [Halomicronema hongdechloris]ASC70174.1 hypothetical protein XM38_011040 [Halomicronema hongdechloris C2206]
MLAWLSAVMLAQATPAAEIIRPQAVRPLPGQLDTVPVFNSNSPELVEEPGILLSTFPSQDMAVPEAHLDFPLSGRFDIFAHHVARAPAPGEVTSLYLGILAHNPSNAPVILDILTAASYLSQPDAPFVPLPELVEFAPWAPVFAGPGSRVMLDVLRQQRLPELPPQQIIPPGQSELLFNQPIPVRTLEPPINGRSTLMQLRSSGALHVASLARYAPITWYGQERAPTLLEWQTLLMTQGLAGPRDRIPTPLSATAGPVIYGRVAGVAQGSQWQARLTDEGTNLLAIPAAGQTFSYGISTLYAGRMGTGQSQSGEMLVRYPDTAYEAHGNYGVHYNLALPLHNPTEQPQTVTVALDTALKEDTLSQAGPRFLESPGPQLFFRGPVRLIYTNDQGTQQIRYLHLVQRRGQQGPPLITLTLASAEVRLVQVDLLYPPDSTPPQLLTIQTLGVTGTNATPD